MTDDGFTETDIFLAPVVIVLYYVLLAWKTHLHTHDCLTITTKWLKSKLYPNPNQNLIVTLKPSLNLKNAL